MALPFMTAYDPPGTSEGSLDPLGLYQIADKLAVMLVPAVRERMQRIRFLTAIAVGAMVTEGLDDDPEQRDASPYLVWEWLVVEAIVRSVRSGNYGVWGVPGTDVVNRALDTHGYVDARSYLKTARIFGFNGVYKRLAIHLGLVDVHLAPGPNTEGLVDAWARGWGMGGLQGAKTTLTRWTDVVNRCLRENPPRTKPGWGNSAWTELAAAFMPDGARGRERRYLRELILAADDRRLGALPSIWELQTGFDGDDYREETLHTRLDKEEPGYGVLLTAIRTYEGFARSLQDGFDILRAEAADGDSQGFAVPEIGQDSDFQASTKALHEQFDAAHDALANLAMANLTIQSLFTERFRVFAEPMPAAACALALCEHHERIQQAKSANGKRPWFDRLGEDRIYMRHAYRVQRRSVEPGRYVHDYRGQPIRRFYQDLS